MDSQILGGCAALVSAASWALGGVLWRKIGDEISPFSMNLCKGVIGGVYLLVVLLGIGFVPITVRDFLLLGLSGLIGIALGDTFFFISLMYLGPRLAALMGTLNPVMITLAAVVFLGERLSPQVLLGIFLVISGVLWVLWERLPHDKIIQDKTLGVKFGILAVLCTTVGVIFAKIAITSVPAMQATFIRLFCGTVGLITWGVLRRQLKGWVKPFNNFRILQTVSYINIVVIFGGFWLSLVALKYIGASVAGTLNATAPIFILPMVALMFGEKISTRAVMGATLTVGGVALIFLGK